MGVQYPSELAGPDAAEVIDGRGLLINSVNEKGCYTGRTAMGKNFKLHPNKEVVLTAESSGAMLGPSNFCRAIVAFTPRPHAHYAVRSELVPTPVKGFFGEQKNVHGCKLSVLQVDERGSETPIVAEPRVLSTGFACIRFVKPDGA